MRGYFHQIRLSMVMLTGLFLFPGIVTGQLISIKTVPVAAGDQFMIFPSQNMGAGGLSIATTDSLLDPFVNPARGGWTNGSFLFAAPATYRITNDLGAAHTLPAGALYNNENWFGGFSLALQQMVMANMAPVFPIREFNKIAAPPLKNQNRNNLYVAGVLGKFIGASDVAVGMGISWAGLTAMDGVELLYPNSTDIQQSGHILDYRVGIYGEFPGERFFQAILVHHRINMTHDVSYPDWRVWNTDPANSSYAAIVERNVDKTHTWGIHLGYRQPISQSGWKMGGILTVNRKSHPKFPNYDLMNIPRDPGTSWAMNLGAGAINEVGNSFIGLEAVYEPIWSHTWANAAEPIALPENEVIPTGEKTVDNRFKFDNWRFRLGVGARGKIVGFQLGVNVHWIRYWLDQQNFIQNFKRSQRESWTEWRPSLGLSLKLNRFTLRYNIQVTTGTGQPGVLRSGQFRTMAEFDAANFLIAPENKLTLQESTLITQMLTLTAPLHP